ncbi:hypothetical protein [Streptomyces sp. NPDC057877]|uniref:hypothetical protein n=1 Tax=Streptomyces sp. NPDC057877 TaxID=3346269 RepID=UPI00367F8C21
MVQNLAALDSSLDRPGPQTADVYAVYGAYGNAVWVGSGKNAQHRVYRAWANRFDPVAHAHNPQYVRWLRSLDRPPRVTVLCTVPYELRHTFEAAATLAYRAAGHRLFNVRIGMAQPPEVRVRISHNESAPCVSAGGTSSDDRRGPTPNRDRLAHGSQAPRDSRRT